MNQYIVFDCGLLQNIFKRRIFFLLQSMNIFISREQMDSHIIII